MRKDFPYDAFNFPKVSKDADFLHKSVDIKFNNNEYKVIAKNDIKSGTIILRETPLYEIFGEKNIDPALQIMYKMIGKKYNKNYNFGLIHDETTLTPRDTQFLYENNLKNNLYKTIRKLPEGEIKNVLLKIDDNKLIQYYFKYLYNAFSMYKHGPTILILGAKLNHNCNPNTRFYPENDTMIFETVRNIKKGEEITDTYIKETDLNTMGTKQRREYLFNHYCFVCKCLRCENS
ncbi:MAG: hypothetical protein Terrestrivirus6_15 [Terrestrivirus sp.]|uniref:SET domain-containing protein n=1 Tax=Terrestrivirus sp. TaxID=2487775 RepID=A0A3G4ZSH8_9VIRU|nr:MAG: hypothetical protein Terrestrivirus6_15 [Terrestrivirus sp.]